jgi:hypothetical protein
MISKPREVETDSERPMIILSLKIRRVSCQEHHALGVMSLDDQKYPRASDENTLREHGIFISGI